MNIEVVQAGRAWYFFVIGERGFGVTMTENNYANNFTELFRSHALLLLVT